MNFGAASYGLGLLAGLLSTLSPCVLPIIPILLGSAANAHPRAPLTLAGGLALSYALIGTEIAWAGASLGLDTSIFRMAGAVLLGALGLVLMSAPLQARLAAAIVLASQGSDLPQVALLMGVFGVGAALPIVGLAYASRTATSRMRGNLLQAGKRGKTILGGVMVLLAFVILSGADKSLETWLVDHSPGWLTSLTTRY